MAASNMALFGGAFFTPILVGKITHTLGWEWTFYFVAIFAGCLFPFVFFFVPETAFRRSNHFNTDLTGQDTRNDSLPAHELPAYEATTNGISTDACYQEAATKEHGHDEEQQTSQPESSQIPRGRFAPSLMPFNGRKTDENFLKLILRPFPLFFHPAVFWGCLIQGTLIGWTVFIGVVLAAVFMAPPLWFTEEETGYMYTGPFIGAVLGFVLSGLLTDWITKIMIRKNKGVYEPEFRIVLVVVQLIVGGVGLYGFGWASQNVKPNGFVLPDFFFALEVMGMVIGAVASALYLVDAHRK